jgi:outer membrane autotransporter protein
VETDFYSEDLLATGALSTHYETKANYFGLHGGAGYLSKLSDKTSFDVYGRYFWNHQKGDTVTLSSQDVIEFKPVNSQRARVGAKATLKINDILDTYFGLAYDHEFSGKIEAAAYGRSLPIPSVKGSTGMGELGLRINAGKNFQVDLGVQGFAGKREGVAGSLKMTFLF